MIWYEQTESREFRFHQRLYMYWNQRTLARTNDYKVKSYESSWPDVDSFARQSGLWINISSVTLNDNNKFNGY